MLDQVFHFGAALGGKQGPGIDIVDIRPEKMLAEIVEGPLGVASLAGDLFGTVEVGGMPEQGNRVVPAVAVLQNEGVAAPLHPGRQVFCQGRFRVAGGAGRAAGSSHQLLTGMTVAAGESLLLMDIRHQLVIFDAVRPEMLFLGRIGGPVLGVIVVFEPAVVIETDVIAVVAGETLRVPRLVKHMGLQLAARKGQMAGAASDAAPNCWIVVPGGIGVAVETPAPQQVVGQIEAAFRGIFYRHLAKILQGIDCPEYFSEAVGAVCEREMFRLRHLCHFCLVAGIASGLHGIRVSRPGDELHMCSVFVLGLVIAAMAGGAGQAVICIEFDRMATGASQQLCRWLVVVLTAMVFPAGGEEEKAKKKEKKAGHHPQAGIFHRLAHGYFFSGSSGGPFCLESPGTHYRNVSAATSALLIFHNG